MSYAERDAMAFMRLHQELMLDESCVVITSGPGTFGHPNEWLSFNGFAPPSSGGRCQRVLGDC